jgi:hypothetical protein
VELREGRSVSRHSPHQSHESEYEYQSDPLIPPKRKQKANSKNHGPTGHRFTLVPFDKIELRRDCAYLIRNIIPREGLIVVWGPPKCGKSFWLYDALMHVALGWVYRGNKGQQGAVVYVACEGERGHGARAAAYRLRHLQDYDGNIPFHLVTSRLDLVGEHDRLIADIRAQIGDAIPAVVAIDTLNRSIVGSESSDEDMTAYVRAAEAIREAFGCAVVIIHHCGLEGSRPRGHTSLTGAVDTQIAVTRTAAGIITATVEYMKDGEEGLAISSKLEVVTVGKDIEGDDITSCVIVDTEAPAPPAKGKRPIPGDYARAREFLANAIARNGVTVSMDGIPTSARVITMEAWKAELRSHGLIGDGGQRDGADARNWLSKMKRRLIGDNLIREAHSYVWLCK